MAGKSIGTISIIMAAYNAERTICDAIESVLSQEYSDFELLVFDDCSVDNTKRMIDLYQDERIHYIRNSENIGPAKTRINAACAAQGDWIAILDSDDAWEKNKLQLQVELLQKGNAVLSYTGYSYLTEDGRKLALKYSVPSEVSYRRLLHHNVIGNSTVVVRRDLFLKYAGADSSIHEDYACWLKCLKEGYIASGINQPLVRYRISTKSKSGNKYNSAKMTWNTYRQIGVPIISRIWYMISYACRGILKYGRIRATIWKGAYENIDCDV